MTPPRAQLSFAYRVRRRTAFAILALAIGINFLAQLLGLAAYRLLTYHQPKEQSK
jgi:hypothetical protein